MKKLLIILIFGCLLGSSTLYASTCPTDRSDYFCLTPEMAPDSKIQIFNFYNTPVKIMSLFHPEISKLNFPLALDARWESPFFGAGVSLYQNQFHLMILGGMTRIDKMTIDAYAAIVCHEIGHLIGGAPYQTITSAEWSSAEGQSDFFAANVCLPRYFRSMNVEGREIPARVEKAGFEMMNALKDYDSNEPNARLVRFLELKKETEVTLVNQYPSIQCRYETFRNNSQRSACWFKNPHTD